VLTPVVPSAQGVGSMGVVVCPNAARSAVLSPGVVAGLLVEGRGIPSLAGRAAPRPVPTRRCRVRVAMPTKNYPCTVACDQATSALRSERKNDSEHRSFLTAFAFG
jgi:hypothetical protein